MTDGGYTKTEAWNLQLQAKVDHLQAALDAAEKRAEEYRAQIVHGFYEEQYPSYHQGVAGEHELSDPITAAEANGLVKKLVEATDFAEAVERALADAKTECAGLAASQCQAFYGDEHGNPRCKFIDRAWVAEAALARFERGAIPTTPVDKDASNE
jgi:hypothetical protein